MTMRRRVSHFPCTYSVTFPATTCATNGALSWKAHSPSLHDPSTHSPEKLVWSFEYKYVPGPERTSFDHRPLYLSPFG
jgi:hypothetical protein